MPIALISCDCENERKARMIFASLLHGKKNGNHKPRTPLVHDHAKQAILP